jgi:hypothetical protein
VDVAQLPFQEPALTVAEVEALATPNEIVNFYELPATKEFLHEYPNPNFEMNQIGLFIITSCLNTKLKNC